MRPGDVVDGKFRIIAEAGAGAMGVVYRAQDLETSASVALKLVRGDPSQRARFQREAKILHQLRHTGIVRYVAHGVSDTRLYLVMEWLEGEDLSQRLERGPLGVAEALDLGHRIADALGIAHARGIVHRDLKPSNLFLPSGDVRNAKILDFGIARVQNATTEMTAAGVVIGTPGYMAPEQARGDARLDARADVFALGCVLFECLTGRAAFVGDNIVALLSKIVMEDPARVSELRANLPAAIDDLVARFLSKAPSERPTDGHAARDALATVRELVADDDDAALPPRRSAVTRGEQHIVSVVIAGAPEAHRPGTEVLDEGTPSNGLSIEAFVSPDASDRARAASTLDAGVVHGISAADTEERPIAALVDLARYGAKVERLADGVIVATLHGAGVATDQAAQAARCALALRSFASDVPIVLATGRATFAGRLPIGPVIERAAKLLRSVGRGTEGSRIHLDEVTAGLLPSRFSIRDGALGPELDGEERGTDVARTVLGRPTRFVGRDAEMGALTGLFSQVESDGIARATIVTAPPGLGKSRLREELVARLAARDTPPIVAVGAAEMIGAGAPLAAIGRGLRHLLGIVERTTAARTHLAARVSEKLPAADALRVTTFLGEIIGLPFDAAPSIAHAEAQLRAARREPPLMAEQTRRAFVDLLRAECGTRPVVFAIEDGHWGDAPSMKMLEVALRELPESPLLVIVFARPEIDEVFPELWSERGVLRLALGPLPARAAERFARSVLGDEPQADAVHALVSQSSAISAASAAASRSSAPPRNALRLAAARCVVATESVRYLRAMRWRRGASTPRNATPGASSANEVPRPARVTCLLEPLHCRSAPRIAPTRGARPPSIRR